MADLLLDTNVFVDHLRRRYTIRRRQDRIFYSVMTRIELLAGASRDARAERELLSAFVEVPVDRSIAERAGNLRRTTAIQIADAIIAATAIETGTTLVTRNLKDFEGVRRLRVRLPA